MSRSIGCQICDGKFARVSCFKKHLNLAPHKQMFSKFFPNDCKAVYKTHGFPYIIFMEAGRRINQPVLGLSHMTLCFSPGLVGTFYLCHICEEICTPENVLKHIFNREHYNNYFAYTDPNAVNFAWMPSMTFLTEKGRTYAERNKIGVQDVQLLHLSENLQKQCLKQPYSAVMCLLHQNEMLSDLFKASIPGRISIQAYKDDVKRQHPLLGLQHLVECICPASYRRRHYLCTLCSQNVCLRNIIQHVLSFFHIYNYLEIWHPSTLMRRECYRTYNFPFHCMILNFAQQSEAIYGTADVQEVTLHPVDFATICQVSYVVALNKIESITKKKEGSLIPVVKPGQRLEQSSGRNNIQNTPNVQPQNKPEPPSSAITNTPSTSTVEPQNKPVTETPVTSGSIQNVKCENAPEPTTQATPRSLYCQNCSRKYETNALYFNHLSMCRHQEMFYNVFSAVHDQPFSRCNKSLPLYTLPCVGTSLILTILSHQLDDDPFYVCFACEVCFYKQTGLLHHINSIRHFIHFLMYQNPWRLPFGWKNRLDYTSLKKQVFEEEEAREPGQTPLKILDVPANIFRTLVGLDFPRVMEKFNIYHTLMMNTIPRRETYSKLKDNERFPLLGRDFLVKYGQIGTGLKFLCLLCERTLAGKDYNGHVFSWEHVTAFLESHHPGSLVVNTAHEEILLDLAKQAARIHRVSNEQEIEFVDNAYQVSDYITKIRLLSIEKARAGKGALKPCIKPTIKLFPRQREEKDTTAKDDHDIDRNSTAMKNIQVKAEQVDLPFAKKTEIEVSDRQIVEPTETCLQSEELMQQVTVKQDIDCLNPQPEFPMEGVTYNENTKTTKIPHGQTVGPMESSLQDKSADQMHQVAVKQEVDGPNPVAGPMAAVSDNENTPKTNNAGESMANTTLKRPRSMLEGCSTSETGQVDPKRMRLSKPAEKDEMPIDQNMDKKGDCSSGDQTETVPSPSTEKTKLWVYIQSKIRGPLIGLSALYECCCDDLDPVYMCECCRSILKEEQIVKHLIGPRHYRNYLHSIKANRVPQGPNWRKNIATYAANWEQMEGYGEAQVVELTTEDFRKISGFEWYRALQIVKTNLTTGEKIKDVNSVGSAAEKSQDQMQQEVKMEIAPDPATTSENTEATSETDVKTDPNEEIDLAKVQKPRNNDVTKKSDVLTERACSLHNIVTKTTSAITTSALSSSSQSTVNPEVGSEMTSIVQEVEDAGLKNGNITSLECPLGAIEKFIMVNFATGTVPSLATTQPSPPHSVTSDTTTSSTTTSLPASTSIVASNMISSTVSSDSLKGCISSSSVSTTDAPKSSPKPQEESEESTSKAAVSCDDEMSTIKLTTIPSETMESSVVNSVAKISTKPTKNNNPLKLKVDVASNNPNEQGNVKNCQFTPSTPQMTEPCQKSTLDGKTGQEDCNSKLHEESSVTTENNTPVTMESTPPSNKKPIPTSELSPKMTRCPKIGEDQLIKVSCKGSWLFYCFACQSSLESSYHLTSTSHQINCVKVKYPWWSINTSESQLSTMVALVADDEMALKPAYKKIEVSSDVYKELKTLPGVKAVEKIRGLEMHKSILKPAVQQRPLFSKNEVSNPNQATSPVLAGQDKRDTKPREETSVIAVKKIPASAEGASRPSCKNQKPTSKVAPRIIGTTTGDSSNLSRFLKVLAMEKPVIGLCLVWECRVVPHKPYKTFYLCESCSKTLSVPEIIEHMPSTEHQWNYMMKQYPTFMYWKDEELLPEMTAELTNCIAGWVSGREESMDAQAVLLSEDYYELVRTAPFLQALKMVQEIKERKMANLPLIVTSQNEGDSGEDQTLHSLENPATDIREQLKRFILQKAEEDSDSDDAKQETPYCLVNSTTLTSDTQPRTNSKDYDKTPSNITDLASPPQKSPSPVPPEPPDVSSRSAMELPDSKRNIFKDGPQLVENLANARPDIHGTLSPEATVASHLTTMATTSECLKNTSEDTYNGTYSELYSPISPACQLDTPVDEETATATNPTAFSEDLKHTNQDPYVETYCELYSPSSPTGQQDSSLYPDVDDASLDEMNTCSPQTNINPTKGSICANTAMASSSVDSHDTENIELNLDILDETIMDMHHIQMLIDLVRETKSLMGLSNQTSTTSKASESDIPICEVPKTTQWDVECQLNTDTDANPSDESMLIEDHSNAASANANAASANANAASANANAASANANAASANANAASANANAASANANAASANANAASANANAASANANAANSSFNTCDNANTNANANTSSEDNLTSSNDAEKPGSANKTAVSTELQSLWFGSVKAIEEHVPTTPLPQNEVPKEDSENAKEPQSQFYVQPLKIQQLVKHLQKDNSNPPRSQGETLTRTQEVPRKSQEVCVSQRLNRLQHSKMKVAQSQNKMQQPESQISQPQNIIQQLENEVLRLEAQITSSQTSIHQSQVPNSSAKLPIIPLITSRPHHGSQLNFSRDCDDGNNQTFVNTSVSQVNQGFPTTDPSTCPTNDMRVTAGYSQFVQAAYVTNANAGYPNTNNIVQYVATQASPYSSQDYHLQQLQAQQQYYTSMQSYGQNVQTQDATMWFCPSMHPQPVAQPFSAWNNDVVTSVREVSANNVAYRNMGQFSAPNNRGYTNDYNTMQQYNAVLMHSRDFTKPTSSASSSMNFPYFPNQR